LPPADDGISAHTVRRCHLPATRASSIPTLTRNVFGIKKKVIKAPIIKIPAMIYKAADRSEETSLAHIGMFGPKITAQVAHRVHNTNTRCSGSAS